MFQEGFTGSLKWFRRHEQGVLAPAADERVRLADAVGMDKGQISRVLAGLVSRRLVS
jgi:hypothetical protein